MVDTARLLSTLRARRPALAADVGVKFVLPFVIYSYASARIGDVQALIASSLPPIMWSFAEFIRHRRLDALSLLVLVGIVLSLLAFFPECASFSRSPPVRRIAVTSP